MWLCLKAGYTRPPPQKKDGSSSCSILTWQFKGVNPPSSGTPYLASARGSRAMPGTLWFVVVFVVVDESLRKWSLFWWLRVNIFSWNTLNIHRAITHVIWPVHLGHWADGLKNIKCRLPEPNKLSTFCIPHDLSWVVQQQKTLGMVMFLYPSKVGDVTYVPGSYHLFPSDSNGKPPSNSGSDKMSQKTSEASYSTSQLTKSPKRGPGAINLDPLKIQL